MSYLPRAIATATAASHLGDKTAADWSDLVAELDRWAGAGRAATLWWRDDDAVAATPQLDRLLRLAVGIPLALAVIPALAAPGLAEALAGTPDVAVLQHGWRHASHARHGKNSEYPASRPAAEVARELAAGRERLARLFGVRALPVFVPPWNRFAEQFLPLLPEAGIAAISATPSRCPAHVPPGLVAIDVHVDLVAWRGDRGFVGESAALGILVEQLRARRLGAAPTGQPIGLLTHHLVTDGPGAAFIEQLAAVAGAHKAVRWAAPAELLR
jgi:peptidoglycan/xylan/chitin deacetylase (PgdA/CDA1 family)